MYITRRMTMTEGPKIVLKRLVQRCSNPSLTWTIDVDAFVVCTVDFEWFYADNIAALCRLGCIFSEILKIFWQVRTRTIQWKCVWGDKDLSSIHCSVQHSLQILTGCRLCVTVIGVWAIIRDKPGVSLLIWKTCPKKWSTCAFLQNFVFTKSEFHRTVLGLCNCSQWALSCSHQLFLVLCSQHC